MKRKDVVVAVTIHNTTLDAIYWQSWVQGVLDEEARLTRRDVASVRVIDVDAFMAAATALRGRREHGEA